ncbi:MULTISPECIES: hypothetical protein [unclassified Rhizobium]|uniref:hypothetical protein n=1 Tax=unclassified Rhizobium TaxID=2613769 RepID=UPI000646AE53|nr:MULTISPECIES: hypothetical protein [unclassified Rhizobium]MBN8951517.1 hypothetical protein [Rhizobium tropici]OJY67746.1 MAG: hypothetical protein BGP09_22720 [Rhizobium sp. 60-20]RKD60221.1 hypothetical protein BJ928_109187 [Rhizobium sp. WW_1]
MNLKYPMSRFSLLPSFRMVLLAGAIVLPLSPLPMAAPPAQAAPGSCWSLLHSKFGPQIEKSVNEADPCKKLPGVDHKDQFEVKSLDVCDGPNGGVQINAHADMACKSHGILKTTIKGQLDASMTVDVGSCHITDLHVGINGPIGELISSVDGLQELARGFAQAKISEICGK